MRYAAMLLVGLLMVDSTTAWEEDANPLTLGPSNITDRRGNLIYTDEVDPAETIPDSEFIGVGLTPSTLFTHGLENADFSLGPPDPEADIEDDNAIPNWRFTRASGGSITMRWVDDTNAPGGKAIRATLTNAQSGDEVYLEQFIPVSPRQRLKLPILRSTVGADVNSLAEVRIQFVKEDRTATGSEQMGTLDPTFSDPQDIYALAGIPSDARWARVRLAIAPDGAVTSDTVDLYEAWAGVPQISYETWTFSDVSLPGTGTAAINAVTAGSAGTPALLTGFFISPDAGQGTIGWVEAISVRLSTGRTAGTQTFQVERVGPGPFGPIATIDATNTTQAWATATLLDTTDMLAPASIFAVRATGAGFTPTTADVLVTVRVAFLQLSTATGGAS